MSESNEIKHTQCEVYIRELGAEIGIPEMALNEHGFAGIELDDIDIYILWVATEQRFVFCGCLSQGLFENGSPADGSPVFQQLLKMNHLMHGASHGAIGLTDTGEITLNTGWAPETPFRAKDMAVELWHFIDDANDLRKQLQEWSSRGVPEPSESTSRDEEGLVGNITHIKA